MSEVTTRPFFVNKNNRNKNHFLKVVFIEENEYGSICLIDLEKKLKIYANETKRVKVGTFCAVSNITGIVSDINKITIMLHKYGFLSFWDYATAAPHIEINMNPNVLSNE